MIMDRNNTKTWTDERFSDQNASRLTRLHDKKTLAGQVTRYGRRTVLYDNAIIAIMANLRSSSPCGDEIWQICTKLGQDLYDYTGAKSLNGGTLY